MQPRTQFVTVAGVLGSLAICATAEAGIILGFEGYAEPGGLVNVSSANPYFESDFVLIPSNDQSAVFDATAFDDMPGNSDSSFFGWGPSNLVDLRQQDQLVFSLLELLIGPSTVGSGPTTVTLSLFFADNTTDTLVYEDLSTATLVTPNITNLVDVVFTCTSDAALDNVTVAVVPAPAGAAIGLMGLALANRRRRAA